MKVDDGKGKGYSAGVTEGGLLLTLSTTITREHSANHESGQAYHLLVEQTATGAGDVIFYMKNTSEYDMIVEGALLAAATDETIEFVIGDTGTPVDGSDATPVNCNAGSGNSATGIFQTGNNITGLSGGSVVDRVLVNGGSGSSYHNFETDLIFPKNTVLTIYCVAGSIKVNATIIFFYNTGD